MSQFKHRNEVNKITDSWIDNYDEQMNENSVQVNQLKKFTPVNTLIKKQEVGQNIVPNPSSLKKEAAEINVNIRPPLQLISRESEHQQLNLQGGAPQTPNMLMSNQGVQRSTTMNQPNKEVNDQSYYFIQEIQAKNVNKYFSQREELDIFKHLSLIYNVNTIVNPQFPSVLKHNQIQEDVYNASVQSLKLQNRLLVNKHLLAGTTLINPAPPQVQPEKTYEKPFKNILTSLFFENKPDNQLLVVEFVNMGVTDKVNQAEKNGLITNSGAINIYNSVQNTNGLTHSQRAVDSNTFFQNYKAFPTLYYLNFEATREPCPFIAIDRIQGRHFIYNNDDKIMVFSNEPISNPLNDKSRPLLYMSLDDKIDEALAQKANGGVPDVGDSQQNPLNSGVIGSSLGKARINPTLQIITDQKGNSALLVIGGYIDLGNGIFQAKTNIKVFNIGKRKIDIKPAFQINMKHPRVNPIIMRVKQSHCKDQKVSQTEDKKYLLLLGGAIANIVENRKTFVNTNTCCSVIEYENIFKQLERRDTTQLEIQQTLKVSYNDVENGRNLEKIAQFLSRGVFIHQKNKKNLDIHNKMFIITEKKKQILHVHAISLSDNFVNIFDADTELKTDNQWCYTNICIIDSFITYITPTQSTPFAIDTNSKVSKQMSTEELVEFNNKKKKEFFESKPKQNKATCVCRIF